MSLNDSLPSRIVRLLHYYPRSIGWVLSRLLVLTLAFCLLKLLASPIYEATCKVTTLPTPFDLVYTEARVDVHSAFGPAMVLSQTHTEFLLSRTIAEDVVDDMVREGTLTANGTRLRHYLINPAMRLLGQARAVLAYGRIAPRDERDELVQRLRRRTRVTNVPGSFILEITVAWQDPHTAALVANRLTERYVELARVADRAEVATTRDYLRTRIEKATDELRAIDVGIEDFKSRNGIYIGEADVSLAMKALSETSAQYREVTSKLRELDTKYEVLDDYTPPSALVSIRADIASLTTRRDALRDTLDKQTADVHRYPEKERQLLGLLRDRKIRESELAAMYENLVRTRIAEAAAVSSVRVIDDARAPRLPVRPNIPRSLLAALVVGLVLSGGYVLAMEHAHRFVRMPADVPELRLAGIVPADALAPKGAGGAPFVERFAETGERLFARLMRRQGEAVPGAESRGAVIARHLDHLLDDMTRTVGKGRITVFAGILPDSGKGLLIERLARRAAATGRRVLVIDADLHAATMETRFGVKTPSGFVDLLRPNPEHAPSIATTGFQVDVLPTGALSSVSDTWSPELVRQRLQALVEQYDLVLMDTAALKVDPRVARLCAIGDAIVVVLDATSSTRSDVEALRERLAGVAAPIGYVLNNVKYHGDWLFERQV